jgi:outer membrane protein TolC
MPISEAKQGRAMPEAGPRQLSVRLVLSCALLSLTVTLCAWPQTSQTFSPSLASIPSGPATNEVVHLTLRDAINMALRFNLGGIESGENTRIARGQRLHALSSLLPQVSAGASENVEQFSAATLGIKSPAFPSVIGPFSYSTAQASLTQTLFSFESIQRFRAARTAEQAAQLTYDDMLDVITLIVGNAYLQVIESHSRIDAAEAQVRNAQALYDQAVDELHAGTSPKIDVTRTGVQLHTEQYNLSIDRNNFAIAKFNLARAVGLPPPLDESASSWRVSPSSPRAQFSAALHQALVCSWCSASCKAPEAEVSSPWPKPSWRTLFRRKNAAWHSLCMASPLSWRPP